ncbi:hypothetical protein Esti_005616 [Eimeria stiedai]
MLHEPNRFSRAVSFERSQGSIQSEQHMAIIPQYTWSPISDFRALGQHVYLMSQIGLLTRRAPCAQLPVAFENFLASHPTAMSQPVGICFLEDAACVLLKESSWRRCSEAEAAGISSAPRESCSMDRLLLFLGRALTFTRRSLYVLLCVNPHKSPPSSLPSPPEDACSAAEKQQCKNAAAFVSCGPEVWKLYVQLSAKLGNLAQRLELPATPIILPWEAENFAADKETTNQESGCCSHWAARARAAVLRHYLMASAGCLRWKPRDEAARCHAIPLVLDEEFTCSDADACSAWPRHWRLTSSAAVTSGSGVRKRVACSLEGTREFLPSEHEGDPSTSGRADAATTFKYTVAAGTFDRLHAGHRLLLAAAVFAASEATGLALAAGPLVTKTRPSMSNSTADIEPFSFRLRAATAFVQLAAAARNLALSISGYTEAIQEECGLLTQQQQQQQQQQVSGRFEGISGSAGLLPQRAPLQEQQAAEQQGGRPRLRLQVFRITDSIGPADRLSFDCLVVSAETLRGAHAVNEVRLKLGNEPVSFLTVELVPSCAQPSPRVFEALHATLPFTKKTGSLHGDTTSGSGSSAGEKASRLPVGAKLELRGTAVVEDQLDTPKGSTLSLSLAAGKETPQGKVSSTELRYLHWKQLGCDCVGWLCGRFHASWCWLLRDRGSCLESTNSAPPAVWQLLCAEHAAPWRRLHTFERIARLLRRLDAEQHSESAEPVVLAVFLGSLLACPCQSLPQITDACATPDGSSQTSASPNWAPPAEAEWWRAAASSLLSELNSYCCEAGAKDKGQTGGHSRKGSTACKHTSLLRALMTAQRASSIATLATPFEPAAGKQNASFTEACGTQASSLDEEAALVKTACRLELLECTSSAFLPLAAGMQQLRDEYFFVEEAQFKRWRELQLRQVLNDADSLTPLKQEEHRHAVVSIKRELEMLTPALTTKVEAATDRTKQS